MPRFETIDRTHAQGQAKELLDGVHGKVGMVPNLYAALANAPSVLGGMLALKGNLDEGSLSAQVKEQIALRVGERNGCDYCVAAHTAIGKGTGLSSDQTIEAREGRAEDAQNQAVFALVDAVLEREGFVTDEQVAEARAAGLDDQQVIEVLGQVILNYFTNYFNHLNETVVDFPAAPQLATTDA